MLAVGGGAHHVHDDERLDFAARGRLSAVCSRRRLVAERRQSLALAQFPGDFQPVATGRVDPPAGGSYVARIGRKTSRHGGQHGRCDKWRSLAGRERLGKCRPGCSPAPWRCRSRCPARPHSRTTGSPPCATPRPRRCSPTTCGRSSRRPRQQMPDDPAGRQPDLQRLRRTGPPAVHQHRHDHRLEDAERADRRARPRNRPHRPQRHRAR